MLVDFRPSDLIDRVDWDDPDFPAFVRMLDKLSIPVTVKNGQRSVRMHVITIAAEPIVKTE